MKDIEPIVSVVIPTRHKPDLAVRAVRSALGQTLSAIEVIVIVDGPDDDTGNVLGAMRDVRLRIKVLPRNLGPAEARNTGVKEARGQWVAFLDHDDEWEPTKLHLQLQSALQSRYPYPIIGCRVLVRHKQGDLLWPTRYPRPNEPMSEYLFCRTQFFAGEGILQSSTIFTAKALLKIVPFRTEAQRHDDLDWVLRASILESVGVEYVPEIRPLAIWHREDTRGTISSQTDWRFSLDWINVNKHLVTPKAYASFLLTWVSANAVQEGQRKESWLLVQQAYRFGQPSILDVVVFLGIVCLPPNLRARMVLRRSGHQSTKFPSSSKKTAPPTGISI